MPKNQLRDFLSVHHTSGQPVVVGVSGGSDSLTLLFACQELGIDVHVAHLDHGWRDESAEEARALEQLVKEKTNYPFHGRRVEPADRNLEAEGRRERLTFFRDVCAEVGAEAVLLGHHADDQAETVFKRVVEGAPLHKLGGMGPVSVVEGVVLWRPFLGLPRKTLKCEPLVDDPSNRDPRFQRSMFRHEVLPRLGRGVCGTLGRLGEEARELANYLDEQVKGVAVREGPLGRWVEIPPLHPVELRHLVRSFRPGLGWEALRTVCELVSEKSANKRVEDLEVDRGRLFLPAGGVRFEVGGRCGSGGWEALWDGEAFVEVAAEDWEVGPPSPAAPVSGHKTLSHWYNVNSVPAFLRKEVPVVYSGGQVVGEFLTGRSIVPGETRISLTCSSAGYKKSNGGHILSVLPIGRNLL